MLAPQADGSATAAPEPAAAEPATPPPPGGELARQCEEVAAWLTSRTAGEPRFVDLDLARAAIERGPAAELPSAINQLAAAGSFAAPLVDLLAARATGADLAAADAVFRVLPAIDPARALQVAEQAFTAEGPPPLRYMAAVSLGTLGAPGVERLHALYREHTDDVSRTAVLRGLDASRLYPLAAESALRSGDAVCVTNDYPGPCIDLMRDVLLGSRTGTPVRSTRTTLLHAERSALNFEADAVQPWQEAVRAALETDADVAASSLLRLQNAGLWAAAVPAALDVAVAGGVAAPARRAQALWLARAGSLLAPHAAVIAERAAAATNPQVAGWLEVVAVAAGVEATPVRNRRLEALLRGDDAEFAALAGLALARGGRPGTPSEAPPGYDRARDAAGATTVARLVDLLVDDAVPLPLALDAVSMWSSGRHEELAAELVARATAPSPRMLQLAARGAAPQPELATRLAAAAEGDVLAPDVARWLVQSGQVAAVVAGASRALPDPSVYVRRRAAQAYAVAIAMEPGHPDVGSISHGLLYAALTAPVVATEVETRDARAPVLFPLLWSPAVPLDAALRFAREAAGGPGAFETTAALHASYDAQCRARPPMPTAP